MSQVTVTPLYEGTFAVGMDKVFNRMNRHDAPPKATLKLSIHPFLIRDEAYTILFDAGLGDLVSPDSDIDVLLGNLEEQGISEYDVTDIFISHLHFDHFGGLAHRKSGFWELTFPDARIWVSEEGWAKRKRYIDQQREEYADFFYFLDSRADLHFLPDDSRPIPPVRVWKSGGHSEHHQVLFYENGEDRFLMAGDVIGRRIAVNRSFKAKFDFDPNRSMDVRTELKELAYDEKYKILAYHETDHPVFQLSGYEQKKGYSVEHL
ncbi:MAG: MBL fold metallo-hydrolase [Balneolaceae bacterium]|nr:MAG: MBL fold metallo-hydrolase [Balneolaceae bacterium]